jgi:hypothetical protein
MDCHDIRLLLAFTRAGGDAIDSTEQKALQEHLQACPECAALASSEQALDRVLGTAMRDVPVPAGLKARVLDKVAVNRPRPWGKIAAAAAVLLLAVGITGWLLRPLPAVDPSDVYLVLNRGQGHAPADVVEKWFNDQGVEMAAWRELNHDDLWFYDIIEFQGRRVPKLVFYRPEKKDGRPSVIAQVIVLRTNQFNTRELREQVGTRIRVETESTPGFVYLSTDDIDAFRRDGPRN